MKPRRLQQIGLSAVFVVGWGVILGAKAHQRFPEQRFQNSKPEQPEKKGAQSQKDKVPDTFSEEIAEQITQQVATGLEQHNVRLLLSAFDADAMVGYTNFRNQVEAMFQQYDSFRVYFRLRQITSDGNTGVALADFQLEQIPRSQDAQSVRKNEQVRFEIRRGKNGWKIVEVKPRLFFS